MTHKYERKSMQSAVETPLATHYYERSDGFLLLENLPQQYYDTLVWLASTLCDVPTAFIAVPEHDHYICKSATGLNGDKNPAEEVEYAHVFSIPEKGMTFNEMISLVSATGEVFAVLGIADTKPHVLNKLQKTALHKLAQQTVALIESRTVNHNNHTKLNQLSKVAEKSPAGIILCNVEKHIIWVNTSFSAMSGFSLEECVDKRLYDFMQSNHYDSEYIQLMRSKLDNEEYFEVDLINCHKMGKNYWINILQTPIYDNQGKLEGYIGISTDITNRKLHDEERERLIGQLTASNTELSRFAYIASHDMQEPLRMIWNFSDLIVKEYNEKLDDEGKEYLDIVMTSAKRMQQMVNDLLEYAKVGNESVKFSEFDPQKNMEHILANLSSIIDKNSAKITTDNLPLLKGNAIQFERLIYNIILNAIKYCSNDTPPEITINVSDQHQYWLFKISDNGIGIETESLKKIFEPFFRLHSWHQVGGTGIGLSVCKRIIENHGGKLWAESIDRQGCNFYFTWPKMQL